MKPVILIPAFKPDKSVLENLVKAVLALDVAQVLVVDDGSGPSYESAFSAVRHLDRTVVLTHPENRGKGEALRTGFRHVINFRTACSGVITMDADGQHLVRDVESVMQVFSKNPDCLVLGVRNFKGQVPLRSLVGNRLTRFLFQGLAGRRISDTQTGLRAHPRRLLDRMLAFKSGRYAYELEALLSLVHQKVPVKEVPITTVYEDNNAVSSFKPLSDSILVYRTLFSWWWGNRLFQMLRYILAGLFATVADLGTYALLIDLSMGIVVASVFARVLAVMVHFGANKYLTFSVRDTPAFPEVCRYLAVVFLNLSLSIVLIFFFVRYLGLGEVVAKVLAQILLWLLTYLLLSGFVFLRDKTD